VPRLEVQWKLSLIGKPVTGGALQVMVRVLNSTQQLPASSSQRSSYLQQFGVDVAQSLGVTTQQISMQSLTSDPSDPTKSLVVFNLVPMPDGSGSSASSLAYSLVLLIGNPSSVIYQGKVTRWIDITYMPLIQVPSSGGGSNGGSPGPSKLSLILIIVLVILLSLGIILCIVVCIKRRSVTEWLMWKLGGFRFTPFAQEETTEGGTRQSNPKGESIGVPMEEYPMMIGSPLSARDFTSPDVQGEGVDTRGEGEPFGTHVHSESTRR